MALSWPTCYLATAQALPGLRIQGRVDEKAISSAVSNPRIQTYDLSPDGSRVALFVASGDLIEAPTWVLIVRANDSTIVSKTRFGTARLGVQGYGPQVAFTPDGKLLVVQDTQTVSVLETTSLTKVRTIVPVHEDKLNVPVRIVTASKSNTVAISFGTGERVLNYHDKRPVRTEMVDVSTGQAVASWESDDIPFSISPHADLVAASDHSGAAAVMGVAILDANSGRKIATLFGGYDAYTKDLAFHKFPTAIVGKFISDEDLMLTPDGNVALKDHAGHDVEGSLKIVRFRDDQVLQEVNPPQYGPTGEIAVSADQKNLITMSKYLAPTYFRHPHWRIPKDSVPKLIVLSNQRELRVDTVMQMPQVSGLRTFTLYDLGGLRIAADGSCISVAEDHGITILTRENQAKN
jgi:hypothetical protein